MTPMKGITGLREMIERIHPLTLTSNAREDSRKRYSQSHLGWHFRMLFQSSKLKARISLFTETWQKRRSSFELSAFENDTPSGIECTSDVKETTQIKRRLNWRHDWFKKDDWTHTHTHTEKKAITQGKKITDLKETTSLQTVKRRLT